MCVCGVTSQGCKQVWGVTRFAEPFPGLVGPCAETAEPYPETAKPIPDTARQISGHVKAVSGHG